jgi:hypothetical protein
MSLGPAQTTGILNIGSHPTAGVRTTGAINIGSNSVGVTPVTIGTTGQSTIALNGTSVNVGTKITSSTYDSTSATTAMSIGGNLTTSGLSIGALQTGGNIDIGNNPNRNNSGQVNICSATTNAPTITIGSLTSNTALNGTSVSIGTKITSPVYDSSAATTNMSIGGNLTTGDLNILTWKLIIKIMSKYRTYIIELVIQIHHLIERYYSVSMMTLTGLCWNRTMNILLGSNLFLAKKIL